MIVGIGINLDTTDFPQELRGIAGSLGTQIDTAELIAEIYRQVSLYLQAPDNREWLADYRAHSCVLGKKITWADAKTTRVGIAESIDEDGALLIRNEQNELIRFHTGEISVRTI